MKMFEKLAKKKVTLRPSCLDEAMHPHAVVINDKLQIFIQYTVEVNVKYFLFNQLMRGWVNPFFEE